MTQLDPIRNDIAHARPLPEPKLKELEIQISKLDALLSEAENKLSNLHNLI